MIEVSVIIPTYNRKERLRKALKCVFREIGGGHELRTTCLSPISAEVIVIDDGSTDGTKEMIEKEFPWVSYVWQENQGPAAARNRGIERARGEWIAFLDSDDEWLPGKLAAQLQYFRRNPALRIAQTEEIWIRNGRRVNPMKRHQKYSGFIFEKCLPLCIVSPSAVMIHREIFNGVGLFDESLPACEDYDLWLRISAKFPIGLLEKPYVVKYGGHPDQRSREFPAMDRFRIKSLRKILASGTLSAAQTEAAQKMLEEKMRIYTQGAIKRGKSHVILSEVLLRL